MPDASDHTSPPGHLDRLYRQAQVLTGNAAQAARLLQATYNRAAAARAGAPSQDHFALLRLMTALAHAQPFEVPDAKVPEEEGARGFHDRVTARVLDRMLPVVFATLPAEDRLLLILCPVEGCSYTDAGRVLDVTADAACARLDRAEAALRRGLHENARPAEYVLLDGLSEEALYTALRRMTDAEFSTPPPDLREAVHGFRPPASHSLAPPAAVAVEQEAAEALVPREVQSRRVRPAPNEPGAQTTSSSRHVSRRKRGGSLRRVLAALLIITLAGGAGYVASRLIEPPSDAGVVTLSARAAGQPRLTLQTSRPAAAEQFVRSQLGQRLDVPAIDQAVLRDVSIVEVAPDVAVPVFSYESTETGRSLTVYAYTYALLGRHPERLHLDPEVLQTIAEEAHSDVRRAEGRAIAIWRHRDEIFVAVAPGDPEALRERLPL